METTGVEGTAAAEYSSTFPEELVPRQARLARQHLAFLPHLLVVLGVLYTFHGFVALVVPQFGPVYVPFFITAAVLCAVRFGARSWFERETSANTIIGAVVLLLLGTTLASIYMAHNPLETTTLLLLTVASGYVFSSTRSFTICLLAIGGGWLMLAWNTFSRTELWHFSMSVLTAMVVAVVMHYMRLRSLVQLHDLQQELELRNQTLAGEILRREKVEAELVEAHRFLEHRVRERTARLVSANDRLRREIQQRREAEADRLGLQTQLAEAHRLSLLGEASTALAHEVKQPLTTIRNFASACLRGLNSGRLRNDDMIESLEAIRSEAIRGGEIVRQVHAFVADASPQMSLVNINEVINDGLFLTLVAMQIPRECITTEMPELPLLVQANRVQMLQVITNLVHNAIEANRQVGHATLHGGIRISVSEGVEGELIVVAVSDSGRGIPATHLQQIFEPRFSTKEGGLGMGLSICRTIVQAHRGRIWVDPEAVHGATVLFALPVAQEKPDV